MYAMANKEDNREFQKCVLDHSASNITKNATQYMNSTLLKHSGLLDEAEFSCMWDGAWIMLQITDNLLEDRINC